MSDKKDKNLAYGGQALIEGVLMRDQNCYAFTVKKPDGFFYKEKRSYESITKKIKFLKLPFLRGIVGLFENLYFGLKTLNKSAEIAFPEELQQNKKNNIESTLILVFSLLFVILIFNALPYVMANFFNVNQNDNPFSFNLIAGLIRFFFFFIYLILISLSKDIQRVFGYHGAEHMVISTYEANKELTIENVKNSSRLHPRCGTSFIFIVFLITILVFPLFNVFFNTQQWYKSLLNLGFIGKILQTTIHILSHVIFGLPIVAGISYEILKLSQKLQNNIFVKILISPGLFFQLFTTKRPDETMIKAAILSLKLLLNEEDIETVRKIDEPLTVIKNPVLASLIFIFLYLI